MSARQILSSTEFSNFHAFYHSILSIKIFFQRYVFKSTVFKQLHNFCAVSFIDFEIQLSVFIEMAFSQIDNFSIKNQWITIFDKKSGMWLMVKYILLHPFLFRNADVRRIAYH